MLEAPIKFMEQVIMSAKLASESSQKTKRDNIPPPPVLSPMITKKHLRARVVKQAEAQLQLE